MVYISTKWFLSFLHFGFLPLSLAVDVNLHVYIVTEYVTYVCSYVLAMYVSILLQDICIITRVANPAINLNFGCVF